ncbi:MAG TPA: nucleotidyl transferase AbiEii/AbiGii toxin family protein [Kiritimatiellia bacterium]|jgi:predicted nucleotidyltransferase component of viral defense system|nr:MAG: hypothetical protein BWX54_00119 [Verrucomicrobia bacterium ADurb.Bin018]HOU59506.1 nucleotidyl transferase AbiEii/AbiGii toxin family protein [Kiritimatiellia bacterium]HQF20750.1 nucleotidyl transferase AbiEii/AbiGii toxin family protein [Kiritimatiellia bacterium]HQG74872.1 nucleotidyl transferase AbiEii/AbiGii toxin family protein [Kiritimatiellia bacterium]
MNRHSPQATVELFHLILLDLLGRKTDRKLYALKGGCNLRFFLKSIRYSEDMDIDVGPGLSKDKLADLMESILVSKTLANLLTVRRLRIVERSAPKQTDTTQRWKFGLEFDGSAVLLRTKIEFSRRGMDTETAFGPVDPLLIGTYELTPILANHYTPQAALHQKIRALATRRDVQARDIFDVDLLLNSGIVPKSADIALRHKARDNAISVGFDTFKAQVLSFLAPDHQNQYDSPDVWDELVLRVVAALEQPS